MMKPWITRSLATACLGSALALAARTKTLGNDADSGHSLKSPAFHQPRTSTPSKSAHRLPAKARGLIKDESLATRLRREGGVTVAGQVHRPGPLPLNSGSTLSTAIERAGGPTPFGSMKRVRLCRGGTTRVFDITRPEYRSEPLLPNDTIEVPQKEIFGN
jgi:hypothetical protein